MNREEAIRRVKAWNLDADDLEVLSILIPELRKSEDERIIRMIESFLSAYGADYFINGELLEIEVWLEKQKDANKAIEAVERIDKYIDGHLANAHDMKDSNPDKKYYRGWDDALGKMAGILQDVYSNEQQKESLHIPETCKENACSFTDEDEDRTINGCLLAANAERRCKRASEELLEELGLADYTKFFYEQGVEKGKKEREKQKEQKPEMYSPLCDTIKDKIREYIVNHFTIDTTVKTDVKSIVKAMEEGVRLGKESQKPAKWNEEDAKMLNSILLHLNVSFHEMNDAEKRMFTWLQEFPGRFNLKQNPAWGEEDERIRKLLIWQVHRNIEDETNDLAQSVYDGIKGHDPDLEKSIEDWKKCLAWLKPLPLRCPKSSDNWKPSEEQMRCFDMVLCDEAMDENVHSVLVQFREQLKRLM